MDDTLYHYIDPGFSHQQVHNYTLLVLIYPTRFSLAVIQEQKLLVWRKPGLLNELTEPGEVQEVLNFSYQNIIHGVSSTDFTLIPETQFKADEVAAIARYLDVQPQDTVFAQPLDANNRIVFKINETLTLATAHFDLPKTLFAATGWIQAIAQNQPSGYNLHININENQFDLVYFEQGKLLLYNTFECANADELVYYTMFAAEQLILNPNDVNILVSGMVKPGDAYLERLSTFFRSASINTMRLLDMPEYLSEQELLALSALTLCASLADV